jgi:hypothetical protein
LRDAFPQNQVENLLANRFIHGNRITNFKPTKSVPKKTKIVQDENKGATANGASVTAARVDRSSPRRRSTGAKKSVGAAKKKPAKTKAVKSSRAVPAIELSDEEIRIRAYFIAERRNRLELSGDSNTDWLEAKRQLLSEVGPR